MTLRNVMPVLSLPRSGHHAIIEWLLKMLPDASFLDFDPNRNMREMIADAPVTEWQLWNMEGVHPKHFGHYITSYAMANRKDISIIRSYENWLASFYRMQLRFAENHKVKVCEAEEAVEEVLQKIIATCRDLTRFWEAQYALQHEIFTIWYDMWLISRHYREKIASLLGLDYIEPDFAKEFTERYFPDKDHLHRAEFLKQDPLFQRVLKESR